MHVYTDANLHHLWGKCFALPCESGIWFCLHLVQVADVVQDAGCKKASEEDPGLCRRKSSRAPPNTWSISHSSHNMTSSPKPRLRYRGLKQQAVFFRWQPCTDGLFAKQDLHTVSLDMAPRRALSQMSQAAVAADWCMWAIWLHTFWGVPRSWLHHLNHLAALQPKQAARAFDI